MSSWYSKYRPERFEEVIFPSEDLEKLFKGFYDDKFIKGNVLLYGKTGIGKTSLMEMMIQRIIKGAQDICIVGRNIDAIDKIKPFVMSCPQVSNQKIIKIEEIDKLSQQAQTNLKDGLMEKFQSNTSFIATTNNRDKLDPALVSRFNIQIEYTELDQGKMLDRLEYILRKENIIYEIEELNLFLEKHKNISFRDIISKLEFACQTKTFKYNSVEEETETILELKDEAILEIEEVTPSTISIGTDESIDRDIDIETQRLTKKYNCSMLDTEQLAQELGYKGKTVYSRIEIHKPMPKHKNMGGNSMKFPIREVAKFICSELSA